MRYKKCLLLVWLVFICFLLPKHAQVYAVEPVEHPLGLDENHPYGRLSLDYITPHVAWANPYQAGEIRALVMAPIWSQRETLELAQRLSLDFTPWMTASFTKSVAVPSADPAFRFFQPAPEVVNKSLQDVLKNNYDVIVIGKLEWTLLPPRQRLQILKMVSQGCGLVYVNPPSRHKELDVVLKNKPLPEGVEFITEGLPLSSLPKFQGRKAGEIVRALSFGKGRMVVLNYHESLPPDDDLGINGAAWPSLTPSWDNTSYTTAEQGPAAVDQLDLMAAEAFR